MFESRPVCRQAGEVGTSLNSSQIFLPTFPAWRQTGDQTKSRSPKGETVKIRDLNMGNYNINHFK
jgi:hypothetical protein